MNIVSVKALLGVISVSLLLTPFQVRAFQGTATARLVIKVVDEQGQPVEDANFRVRFSPNEDPVIGKSDSKGLAAIAGHSSDGVIIGEIAKKDFYKSSFHKDFFVRKFGRWQPWNKEITVVLRPIGNPVPMYVRNRFFEIPMHGKEIGFDLMKADWVIPYGQGTHSDFVIRIDRRYENDRNYDATMILTFANPADGIQVIREERGGDFSVGSMYRLSRIAPEVGYQDKLIKTKSTKSPDYYALRSNDINYIFRVRSEVDDVGKIKRSMYGKILGELKFLSLAGKNRMGGIEMHYFLNPDYTKNLEFDPNSNLFGNLSDSEGVALP